MFICSHNTVYIIITDLYTSAIFNVEHGVQPLSETMLGSYDALQQDVVFAV